MENKLIVGIFGASGRLGRSIASLACQDRTFEVGVLLTHSKSKHLDELIEGIPLLSDPTKIPVDLYIDVSLPEGLSSRLAHAVQTGRPMVIGATGISSADRTQIEAASQKIPLLYTPNFSLGMALLRKLARDAARYFHADADIDLIETHHTQKKDAPSGSALMIARAIQDERADAKPCLHSIRSGSIPGTHELNFNTAEEEISLIHTVHSRNAFAKGALAAARFLSTQPPGLYDIDSLVGKEQSAVR